MKTDVVYRNGYLEFRIGPETATERALTEAMKASKVKPVLMSDPTVPHCLMSFSDDLIRFSLKVGRERKD